MYTTNVAYETAIMQPSRCSYISGTITLSDGTVINVTNSDIIQGSLYYTNQCVPDSGFDIGYSCMGEMGFSLRDSLSNDNKFSKAVISLNFNLEITDGTYRAVPLGIFTVQEAKRNRDVIKIVAYDNMYKFDVDYPLNDRSENKTIYERLSDLCTAVGVEIYEEDWFYITLMPNGELSHNLSNSPEIVTARDYIEYVCQLLCGFATINREGKLSTKSWYSLPQSRRTIPINLRKTSTFADEALKYKNMQMNVSFDASASVSRAITAPTSTTETGQTLTAYSNVLLRSGLYLTAQTILNATAAVLTNTDSANGAIMTWLPNDVEWIGDPALDLGDWVTYTGGTAGDGAKCPITKIDWTFRGGQKISSAGYPSTASATSRSEKSANAVNEATYQALKDYTDEQVEAVKSTSTNITVLSTAWLGTSAPYSAQITVTGVTADNMVHVCTQSTITTAQVESLSNAMITSGSQATDTLTLYAFGDKPTVDLPLTVIIEGDLSSSSATTANADKTYEHTQSIAATTWNIAHNLNKYPHIDFLDGNNSRSFVGDISYTDKNNVVATFKTARFGKAVCN